MPSIDDFSNIEKKFKKKTYRPWLMDDVIENNNTSNDNNVNIYPILKEESNEKYSKIFEDDNKKIEHNYKFLKGIQKNIFNYIFDNCSVNKNLTTNYILKEDWIKNISADISSIQQSILRLLKKNLIIKTKFKTGYGGFTQYKLDENTYNIIKKLKGEESNL
jgi:hypothetical protein